MNKELRNYFTNDETVSDKQCPICNSLMNVFYYYAYDGNTGHVCMRNKEHRFWTNPRSKNIHLKKYGSLEDWDYDRRWKMLDNGKYEEHL